MVTQLPDGVLEFRFFRPCAQHISLVGDFNKWQKSFQMTRETDGWWTCRLRLAPGIYQFKYSVDGEWFIDYAAFGLIHGPYGLNSVAKVDPATIVQSIPNKSHTQAA